MNEKLDGMRDLRSALAQLEEGGDDPQREAADAVQRQRTADDG